jgi:hypothetical protein
MRFSTIAVGLLFLLFLDLPTASATNSASGHNFGSANCPQKVVCPGKGTLSQSDMASGLSMCVKQQFGVDPGSIFEDASGLDGQNCVSGSSNGKSMVTKCCLIQASGDVCYFHCDMLTP